MSTGRIVRNVSSNYATYALNGVIGLVLTAVLLRGLGKQAFAVFVLVQVVYTTLGLIDLGLLVALVRSVSAARARQDTVKVAEIVSTAFYGLGAAGFAVSAAVMALAHPMTKLLGVPADVSALAAQALPLGCAGLGLDLAASVVISYSQGNHEFHWPNVVETCVRLMRAGVMIWLVRNGYGLIPVMAVFPLTAAARLFGNLLMVVYHDRAFRPRVRDVRLSVLSGLQRFSLLTFVESNVSLLFLQADALLAPVVLAFSQLAVIGAVRPIATLLPQLSLQALTVAFPMVVAVETRGERQAQRRFLIVATRNWLFAGASFVIFVSMWAAPLLSAWLGPDMTSGAPILRVLLVVGLEASIAYVASTLLYGIDRLGFLTTCTIGAALLGVAAAWQGGHNFGATGMIWGLVVAHTAAMVLLYAGACLWAEIPLRQLLAGAVAPCLPSFAVAAALSYVTLLMLPHTWFGVIVASALAGGGAILVFIMVVRPAFSDWQSTVRTLIVGN